MGPPSYLHSIVDRNIVMQCMTTVFSSEIIHKDIKLMTGGWPVFFCRKD